MSLFQLVDEGKIAVNVAADTAKMTVEEFMEKKESYKKESL